MEEFQLKAFGLKIRGGYLRPERPRGSVVLVHGFGEHSGRYLESVAPMLLECGLAVVLYDNIGHGKSGGKRGHCPSYEALLDVLEMVVAKTKNLFPELPLYLYGHSMGGNLVLNVAIRRSLDIRGLVVTSPYLRLAFDPPKWKLLLGRWMLHIMPSITLPSGLDPKGISRIPEEVEKYKTDPLTFDQVSPMYSLPVMEAGEWAVQHAADLKTEALLLHGTGDPIIDFRATEELHKGATGTSLYLFEGAFHELHHDRCKEELLSIVQKWLDARIP
ncbi:alpha/beta hydrolase [Flavobacteriaceae bacterium TP-CH-4]|uniref:Alpha/beta hydrolase n=1 Tax=Pelagihabitans pacificus TaxID=2696054 RepID=A0A967ASZ7_9FLAO|nr:alpha/beta hydrolase [Pelagihabitans pacificus]NHF59819.1 alpha/beta hydrolase [Pelagihabitans pacificus]